MKLNKKKDEILHIRLTSEEKYLFAYVSALYGKKPSKYLRMLVSSVILPYQIKLNTGVLSYEDIETFFNYQLQLKRISRKKD